MDTVNLHETIKSDVMIMSNTEDNEIDTFAKGLPVWDLVPPQVTVRRRESE